MTARQALQSSKSTEWYTPPHIIAAARQVLGVIGLDPASCAAANEIVGAERILTIADDGLVHRCVSSSVFLNPPYGRQTARWVAHLRQAYASGDTYEAILLVNAVPGRRWFYPLWDYPICFARERICFIDPATMQPRPDPTHDNAFVYFGPAPDRFQAVFEGLGTVVERRQATSALLRALGRE